MKTVPCDYCDAAISGNTFDEWMEAAKAHYGTNHTDKIVHITKETKMNWVAASKLKFDSAPEQE
jgi:hypothetical protein